MARGRNRFMALGALLVALASSSAVAAEEPAKSPWEFEFALYGWIPATSLTADVQGHTVHSSVSVKDVLDIVTSGNGMAGGGYAAVRYDRFSLFVDAFGGFLEESMREDIPTRVCTLSASVKGEVRLAIVDFAVGYRLGQWSLPQRRRPVSLGVYAGMRYAHAGIQVDATLGVLGGIGRHGALSTAINFADPLIGIRWEVPVLDSVSVDFRGDIGGFGASSNLVWGLVGDARYWFSWNPWSLRPWLSLGYKVLSFDRDPGRDAAVDLVFRGPYIALGVVF